MDTTTERKQVDAILAEDRRRMKAIAAPFDPLTGEGSVGGRVRVLIPDFVIPVQWIPLPMSRLPLVRQILKAGSIARFLAEVLHVTPSPSEISKVARQLIRLRCRHDFPFWCAAFVYVKPKGGGDDILFRLWRPQRRLVEIFEKARLARRPIRVIMLKARQWGGSTTTQLYMAWLQFLHCKGLNSLIIAHQGSASDEIKDMFDRMIARYPVELTSPRRPLQ